MPRFAATLAHSENGSLPCRRAVPLSDARVCWRPSTKEASSNFDDPFNLSMLSGALHASRSRPSMNQAVF